MGRSPRASMRAFASCSAQLWMLRAREIKKLVRATNGAPRVGLDVKQDGRDTERAEHAPIVDRLPALALPLLPSRRWLRVGRA